jgi:hypothetical protein
VIAQVIAIGIGPAIAATNAEAITLARANVGIVRETIAIQVVIALAIAIRIVLAKTAADLQEIIGGTVAIALIERYIKVAIFGARFAGCYAISKGKPISSGRVCHAGTTSIVQPNTIIHIIARTIVVQIAKACSAAYIQTVLVDTH